MENAGASVVDALEATLGDLDHLRIGVVCGVGNNGGDGFVVSRLLSSFNCDIEVWIVGDSTRLRPDANAQYEKLLASGMSVVPVRDVKDLEVNEKSLNGWDVLVDALLGTGLNKALTGLLRNVVSRINRSSCFVVSIDVPSGISDFNDSAESVRADLTVSLGAKPR